MGVFMAEKRDYYEVLGVAKDADDAAIKKAYREIAKKYHPDINPSAEAAEIFKEASEAYSVLSDKEKRAQYDQFGHAAFDGSGGGYGGGFSGLAAIWETSLEISLEIYLKTLVLVHLHLVQEQVLEEKMVATYYIV